MSGGNAAPEVGRRRGERGSLGLQTRTLGELTQEIESGLRGWGSWVLGAVVRAWKRTSVLTCGAGGQVPPGGDSPAAQAKVPHCLKNCEREVGREEGSRETKLPLLHSHVALALVVWR